MTHGEASALVQGWADTRETLDAWNARPGRVLRAVVAGSLAIAIAAARRPWVVARQLDARRDAVLFPGLAHRPTLEDVGLILYRNGLVLALHAMACVAGFIAGCSLPLDAERYSGVWRWIHDKAGPLAIAFVIAATLFSLADAGLRARQRRDHARRRSASRPRC